MVSNIMNILEAMGPMFSYQDILNLPVDEIEYYLSAKKNIEAKNTQLLNEDTNIEHSIINQGANELVNPLSVRSKILNIDDKNV